MLIKRNLELTKVLGESQNKYFRFKSGFDYTTLLYDSVCQNFLSSYTMANKLVVSGKIKKMVDEEKVFEKVTSMDNFEKYIYITNFIPQTHI